MSPRARPELRGTLPTAAAEVGLVLVHVAVVLAFARLYRGWAFLGPLLAFVLSAHAIAYAGRRWRLPLPVVAVGGLAAAALVAAWTLYPDTTAYGLPTGHTWHTATASLRDARTQFEDVLAPVEVVPGFQVAAGLALTVCVWFADWAAFRLRTSLEAIAPACVLFVFGAVLGSGRYQVVATLLFGFAVLGFIAAHRAMRAQADQAWLAEAPAAGPRALVRSGLAVAAVAVLAGSMVGPRLPGATSDALVEWRASERPGGSRVTVSPMVELRKRLVDQSNTELFTVEANRPAYWRLTALDRFDGQIWSSSGTYRSAGERLPTEGPRTRRNHIVTQQVRIAALSTIWAPAAFEPRGVSRESSGLRWDDESSTLIVDDSKDTSDGLDYTVVSEVPEQRASVLARDPGRDAPEVARVYERLPADFPVLARNLARSATRNTANRYEKARALQDWFRTRFRYSLSVPPGHSDDALVDFLDSREGYCEQFAGAYAAMARSLGMPARVAVGFTPGAPDPEQEGVYHVLGRHAHAWPEVWFPSVGWVPFEPTPGRGMPDAREHTGVPPAQDATPVQSTFGSIVTSGINTTSTTPVGGSTPSGVPSTRSSPRVGTVAPPASDDSSGAAATAATVVGIVVVGALIWFGVVLATPALRRRRRHLEHADAGEAGAVLDAWDDAVEPVGWSTGIRPHPAETHPEFAMRAGAALGAVSGPFRRLADLVSQVSWSPAGVPAGGVSAGGVAAEARGLADDVRGTLLAQESRPRRLRRRLSWREAFGRQASSSDRGGSSSRRRRLRTRSVVSPK